LKAGRVLAVWILATHVVCAGPNTILPRVPENIVIDGNLDDWKGVDFIPIGVNSSSEASQAAYLYQGWTTENLLIAAKVLGDSLVLPKYDAYACDGVAIYLDSRPPRSLHHFPYQNGAFRLLVYPTKGGTAKAVLTKLGEASPMAKTVRIEAKFIRTATGWTVEMAIPWSIFGINPKLGDKIGLGVNLLHSNNNLAEGEEQPATRTTGASPETDPLALSVVGLVEAGQAASGYSVEFEEVASDREVVLHGTICSPPSESELSKGITVEMGGKAVDSDWSKSYGGQFCLAEFMASVPTADAERGMTRVTISKKAGMAEKVLWTGDVPLPLSRMKHWMSAEFARIEHDGSVLHSAPLINYLEQLGGESISCYLSRRNNLRHIVEAEPNYNDPAISTVLAAARALLRPEVATEVDNRLHVWKSKLDGSWHAFQVLLPVNYSSSRKWPLEIYFHPLYNNLGEVNLVHEVTAAVAGTAVQFTGERATQYLGEQIQITLFGHGNSFEELGDEEFSEALDYGVNVLEGDRESLRLAGPSDGATDAMTFAIRYSDRVASIDVRGGGYTSRSMKDANLTLRESMIVDPTYDLRAHVNMLRGISGRLSAGERDPNYLKTMNSLGVFLKRMNSPLAIDIIPNAGHNYQLPALKLFAFSQPAASVNDPVIIGPNDIRYASKDGISIQRAAIFGPTWVLKAYVTPECALHIETNNVDQFILTQLPNGPFAKATKVEIDGDKWDDIGKKAQYAVFSKVSGHWMKSVDPVKPDTARKSADLSGPMVDIRRRPFLIVCGTKDKDAMSAIKDRAQAIIQTLSGWRPGEDEGGRYTVVDDVDCTPIMREGKSIWLIGNHDENSLYDELNGKSQIVVSHAHLQFGVIGFNDPVQLASYLIPNQKAAGQYILIEAATDKMGYVGPVFQDRIFDFAIYGIDLRENPLQMRGFFDEKWQLKSELTFKRK